MPSAGDLVNALMGYFTPDPNLSAPYRPGFNGPSWMDQAQALQGADIRDPNQRAALVDFASRMVGPTALGTRLTLGNGALSRAGLEHDIYDQYGDSVANLSLDANNKKHLFVNDIETNYEPGGRYGANVLGPGAVKSLIPEIRRLYPDALTLSGERVSGAKASSSGVLPPSPVFSIKNPPKWTNAFDPTDITTVNLQPWTPEARASISDTLRKYFLPPVAGAAAYGASQEQAQ